MNQTTGRQRLAAIIARQDAARGRPLTAQEQLENLAAALADGAETPCPICGVSDDQECPHEVRGQECRLNPCQHDWDFKSNLRMWGCTKCGVHREAHTRG